MNCSLKSLLFSTFFDISIDQEPSVAFAALPISKLGRKERRGTEVGISLCSTDGGKFEVLSFISENLHELTTPTGSSRQLVGRDPPRQLVRPEPPHQLVGPLLLYRSLEGDFILMCSITVDAE